jgi:hypothetical protein
MRRQQREMEMLSLIRSQDHQLSRLTSMLTQEQTISLRILELRSEMQQLQRLVPPLVANVDATDFNNNHNHTKRSPLQETVEPRVNMPSTADNKDERIEDKNSHNDSRRSFFKDQSATRTSDDAKTTLMATPTGTQPQPQLQPHDWRRAYVDGTPKHHHPHPHPHPHRHSHTHHHPWKSSSLIRRMSKSSRRPSVSSPIITDELHSTSSSIQRHHSHPIIHPDGGTSALSIALSLPSSASAASAASWSTMSTLRRNMQELERELDALDMHAACIDKAAARQIETLRFQNYHITVSDQVNVWIRPTSAMVPPDHIDGDSSASSMILTAVPPAAQYASSSSSSFSSFSSSSSSLNQTHPVSLLSMSHRIGSRRPHHHHHHHYHHRHHHRSPWRTKATTKNRMTANMMTLSVSETRTNTGLAFQDGQLTTTLSMHDVEQLDDVQSSSRAMHLHANVNAQPVWELDRDAPCCKRCKKKFIAVYRSRHHCRCCGYVFCGRYVVVPLSLVARVCVWDFGHIHDIYISLFWFSTADIDRSIYLDR